MKLSDTFIGQQKLAEQIQLSIDASIAKAEVLPHVLLIAPPGVGKTYLAWQIARLLSAPYASLTFPGESKLLPNMLAGHCGLVLLDEIHELRRKEFDLLLPFLDHGEVQLGRISRFNDRLTVVAATTDPQNLPDAFLSRFRIRPEFEDYSIDSIREIIHKQCLDICEDDAVALASASLGNPRQAVQLAETYDDIRTVRSGAVDASVVLDHLGINRDGLRTEHLRYLRNLKSQNGVASESTLSKMAFMPKGAMKWVERDLLRLGIISVSSAGRELISDNWESETEQHPVDEDTGPVNPYTLEPN